MKPIYIIFIIIIFLYIGSYLALITGNRQKASSAALDSDWSCIKFLTSIVRCYVGDY